jgi:hypothetical protein
MRTGDRADGPRLAKSLGRNGYPPGLRGSHPMVPDRHGAENTGPFGCLQRRRDRAFTLC